MIQKLEISGIHLDVENRLRNHTTEKLGRLDRYIPRHARDSAHMEVRFTEPKIVGKKLPQCEATLYLPRETITIHEVASTAYAAVDVVETKLKQQIKRYKDKLPSGERSQHIFARLRGRISRRLPDQL